LSSIQSQASNQAVPATTALVISVLHGLPILGVLFLGWSPIMVLFIYLIENVLTIQVWNRAIARHRLLTRKRGHFGTAGLDLFNYGKRFYENAMGLTTVHAVVVMVVSISALAVDGWLSFSNLTAASLLVNPLWYALVISFCVVVTWHDLKRRTRRIETRSFEWLDENIRRAWWDVHAMHFGLFIGGLWLIFGATAAAPALPVLLALPVVALRAWLSYKQHRPFESLETRRPRLREIGTKHPSDRMIRQWRETMLEHARRREELVPESSPEKSRGTNP
jgi:hypothetical protein